MSWSSAFSRFQVRTGLVATIAFTIVLASCGAADAPRTPAPGDAKVTVSVAARGFSIEGALFFLSATTPDGRTVIDMQQIDGAAGTVWLPPGAYRLETYYYACISACPQGGSIDVQHLCRVDGRLPASSVRWLTISKQSCALHDGPPTDATGR